MLRINLFFSSNLNCETHLFVNVCTYSQLIRLRYCLKRTSYIHTFYIYIYMSLEECIGLCHISMYVYIRLCISLCTISGEEARDLGTSFATPLLPVTHHNMHTIDREHIHPTVETWKFNRYVQPAVGRTTAPPVPTWFWAPYL